MPKFTKISSFYLKLYPIFPYKMSQNRNKKDLLYLVFLELRRTKGVLPLEKLFVIHAYRPRNWKLMKIHGVFCIHYIAQTKCGIQQTSKSSHDICAWLLGGIKWGWNKHRLSSDTLLKFLEPVLVGKELRQASRWVKLVESVA